MRKSGVSRMTKIKKEIKETEAIVTRTRLEITCSDL